MFLVVAIFCWGKAANAVPFSPFEKNVEALNESLLMTASMLVQSYGVSPAMLSFSGTFQDSSWNASMSGVYAGASLNLSFAGTFNIGLDQGSFTSAGTLGTSSWNGGGAWSFTDVDANSILMLWDSEATITLGTPAPFVCPEPDTHFSLPGKQWGKSADGTKVSDFGTYRNTCFGAIFGLEKQEISDWIYTSGSPQTALVTVSLPDDFVVLKETANFDNGTVNGTITIPEAPTFFLFMAGIFVLALSKPRSRVGQATAKRVALTALEPYAAHRLTISAAAINKVCVPRRRGLGFFIRRLPADRHDSLGPCC